MSNPLNAQGQGDVIAQCVFNPFTDAIVSQWGFTGGLTTVVTKQSWILALINTSAVAQAGQCPAITYKRLTANPARTVEVIIDATDAPEALRFQVVDFAGAAANAGNGDTIQITVFRSQVPT